MIKNTTFVIVDTETTGAVAYNDKLVEIGAVKVINGEIIDTFSSLINPERLIPYNVIQIHNITDNMVVGAPLFKDIAKDFIDFLGEDSVFVAHNVDFDKDFINYELDNAGYNRMSNQALCTLKLARRVFPDFRRYNLGQLSQNLGIKLENAHRALDDSMATAKILLKIFKALELQGKTSLSDLNLKSITKTHPSLF